jgi:hypothetical protein
LQNLWQHVSNVLGTVDIPNVGLGFLGSV